MIFYLLYLLFWGNSKQRLIRKYLIGTGFREGNSLSYTLGFSKAESYMIYYGVVIFATFFAYLSEKFAIVVKGKKHVNKFFWGVSFLCLFVPLGFREGGIDHEAYQILYSQINFSGAHYNGFPEPLFTFLNYLVGVVFGKFHYVYIFSALITLGFIYLGFSKRIGKDSLAMCVWMLSSSCYFYMYGVIRIFIAVAIIIYAHQYIEQKKTCNYFFWCLMAACFHYSALIMIPLYFVSGYKSKNKITTKSNIRYAIIAAIVTPTFLFVLSKIFISIFSNFIWFNRYSNYFKVNFNLGSAKMFIWILPLLFIVLLFGKQISNKIPDGQILIRMFWILVSLIVISTIFPMYRLTFFFYYIAIYLYAAVAKLQLRKQIIISYFFNNMMLIIGLVYINFVLFASIYINPFLLPYFFNLP